MSTPKPAIHSPQQPAESKDSATAAPLPEAKPSVAVVLPAFNESAMLEKSLTVLCTYLKSLEDEYRWEILLVNDGSKDDTGAIAEAFAHTHEHVTVIHHPTNFGMGQAVITGFKRCHADYVITLDLDLSYSPDHIRALLTRIRETRAKIVVASPYMKGGKISNVPWLRKVLSVWANRFLSRSADGALSSLTGIARAYDGRFLRSLNLKSFGMSINTEIIYKAMVLRARIDEIPGHLDWQFQNVEGGGRQSSMRIIRQFAAVLLSGFLFRPFLLFVMPGIALLLFAAYVNIWVFIHFWGQFQKLSQYTWFLDRASYAVAASFKEFPHTFVVGGLATILGIQLLSLGILALQNKKYFEEVFHLGSGIFQIMRDQEQDKP